MSSRPPDQPDHARQDPSEAAEPRLQRLDPDQVATPASPPGETTPGEATPGAGPQPPAPINTRRYRWMIGGIGVTIILVVSVVQFATRGVGTTGVPPGKRLHFFVAPLASSPGSFSANTRPRCDPSHPNPQGLNICGRTPIVLAFFDPGSSGCRSQVDTLQTLSRSFSSSGVQFAAVAVHSGRAQTAALIRTHGWSIPVAYDLDGALGGLYGVAVCPMLELAYRGGIVADRLIGNHWVSSAALAERVRGLVGNQGSA